MKYLQQRSSGYYFRLRIPPDLKSTIGIFEIKRSLKTGSLCLAKERAYLISGRLKKLFRVLRGTTVKLTKEKITDIINQYIQEGLDNIEEFMLPSRPISPDRHDNGLEVQGMLRSQAVEDMILFNYKAVGNQANKRLKKIGIAVDKDSDEYRRLCHGILRARVGLQDVETARFKGDYGFKFPYESLGLPVTPKSVETKPKATTSESPLLKDLADEWMNENTSAENWKPRSIKAYKGHFKIILQILGDDIHISSFDHPTTKAIKDTLLKIPTGMNKKKLFQNKTVPEIIEINETEQLATLSISTVNRYLITLGAFFKWCIGNGYMATNFAEGKKIPTKKKRPDEIRDAFTPEHLNIMFQAQGYLDDSFDQSFKFWLPILGLYTGARLNELCQLRLDDIQTIEGICSIVFQEDEADKSISIKSSAGHRIVPIHPFVADDLNLKGYVARLKDEGKTRLFPELPYQNYNYGHKASKWFKDFRCGCGLDSDKLVYHSFRHSLTDNLKQQLITETLIDELTGHAIQGETMGRYGKRYSISVLYNEAVLKLDYGVDLNHLKTSKWIHQ